MSTTSAGVIAKLDKELRALWTAPEDPADVPLSRVCTMNIEVVAPTSELLDRYTPVVDEVTASIPARAILASIEPDASGDELSGSATAVCSLEGGKKICSERIVLKCRGDGAARAASAMEAFLVPEIPTALVWLGKVHVEDPVFEDLANDAHRIILDSEYTSITSVIQVAAWARKQPNAPRIMDLAWTRVAAWQELLARFFDATEHRELAPKISRVKLKQAGDHGARIGPEAALMLGWLGTRLGWKIARLGGAVRVKNADGGNVAIELGAVPRPAGTAPQILAALEVEVADGDTKLLGAIERELATGPSHSSATTVDADVLVWRLTLGAHAPIEHRVRLGSNKAAKWLERTLHRPAHDVAFDESVAFAEALVEDGLTVS
ncbi:MAG: glucose-6-phosphate dehydrogenase assembly protein OpcA [Labilithrix sp.]|nr:glucose-6-phosphate dehydrogenase assembly protein OpcA [Labilithrix sp.]MCW5816631.1 glucose-6-phosphate dehydrogenase assembly protein OpcA [Labilithrix sp.]